MADVFSLESMIVIQVDHLLANHGYVFTEDITDLEGKMFRKGEEVEYRETELRHRDGTLRLKFADGRDLFIRHQSVRHLFVEAGQPVPPPLHPAPPVESGPVESSPAAEPVSVLVAKVRRHEFDAVEDSFRVILNASDPMMLAYELRDAAHGLPRTELKARKWLLEKASDAIRIWASWATSGGEGAARMYEVKKFEASL